MKRKSTTCRIVQVLFLAAFAVILPIAAKAQETTLTTVIPSSHTLHIEVIGEGTIWVDGVACTKTTDVQVQRLHRPEISIQAANDSKIKTVLWGGEDISVGLQNGKWTAPEAIGDMALTVAFESVGGASKTGDLDHPEVWGVLLILSTVGFALCLLLSKKRLV